MSFQPRSARCLYWALLLLFFGHFTGKAVAFEPSPPGVLYPLGNQHHLHLNCQGSGSPTVIFDAGLGGDSLQWTRVQRLVAQYTRACSYDRAGMGWSERHFGPRTAGRMASDLRNLLRKADVPGPYVLVSHSFSSYTARIFARRHPQDIAGLVFIDPSHEDQILRFKDEFNINLVPSHRGFVTYQPALPANMPEEVLATAKSLQWSRKRIEATREELMGFRESARQVATAPDLPAVPMLVLTRGVKGWPREPRAEQMEALWLDLHRDLVSRSPTARHVVVPDSGHHIHLDNPNLVADGILLVLEQGWVERRRANSGAVLRHAGVDGASKGVGPGVEEWWAERRPGRFTWSGYTSP